MRRVGDPWKHLYLVEGRRKVGHPWNCLLHGCEPIELHSILVARLPRCTEGEAAVDALRRSLEDFEIPLH